MPEIVISHGGITYKTMDLWRLTWRLPVVEKSALGLFNHLSLPHRLRKAYSLHIIRVGLQYTPGIYFKILLELLRLLIQTMLVWE
jgi:hypothetical protein